ncbi:MAG TPA: L-arabinose isomerase [Clostridiaceae bacterium]|nr:L-arabinose isomerase [Clostridiaceae bacterium]
MKKLYFLTGTQPLYGPETLQEVADQSLEMVQYLNSKTCDEVEIVHVKPVADPDSIYKAIRQAEDDEDCIGTITWMHTFSPAKMWIKGLKILRKPMLHLHTQFHESLPFDTIDMDYMNLNQSAHGDREFGFICTRLGVKRETVVGYYKSERVINKINKFMDVARGVAFSNNLSVAMFGNNMREVAVTGGDRLESQIQFGWRVNYYAIGDLTTIMEELTEEEIKNKISEYQEKYIVPEDTMPQVYEDARFEAAMDKFLEQEDVGAFTDTFQDLYGLKQLPGLAAQNLMDKGVGFGPEGDFKSAALGAVLYEIARLRDGGTGFMEDYTYDLNEGKEFVMGSHMLEVPPAFASDKPVVEVHPLGIGGKADPARLKFKPVEGDALQICLIDLGDRFRLIAAEVELINPHKETPKLPVASLYWKIKPDFETGVKAWLEAGAGHHSVLTTALDLDDIRSFAKFTNTELIEIY